MVGAVVWFMNMNRIIASIIRSFGFRAKMPFRKLWLRGCGVTFGKKLFLEGPVGVGTGTNVRLGHRVQLGNDVYLGAFPSGKLIVGNDCYIGRWVVLLAHQSIEIGNDCNVAPGCHITDVNHGIEVGELIRKQPLDSKPIKIGNDVWIGAGCSILPGVTIGDGAVIGARTVVTKDIPANAVAVGIPARVFRYRSGASAE